MSLLTINAGAVTPLWKDLHLTVEPRDFIAVLGPNGVGKSTLLSCMCGNRTLDCGTITSSARIGFVPQQRMFPADLPLRGYDLVSLALAHGITRYRRSDSAKVMQLLDQVGATGIAFRRVGTLSGGQQQLIRQAQALATDPQLLLLDEPLLSLDPAMQTKIVNLLHKRRTEHDTAIIFVTHSINPVVEYANKVLYLGPQGHDIGPIEQVMTSKNLSELYGAPVEVIKANGRMVVV